MEQELQQLRNYIEDSVVRHKPYAYGTKGTISYVGDYLKNYTSKMIECLQDATDFANTILEKFEGTEDGEKLQLQFAEEIKSIANRFKTEYWS